MCFVLCPAIDRSNVCVTGAVCPVGPMKLSDALTDAPYGIFHTRPPCVVSDYAASDSKAIANRECDIAPTKARK